MQFRLIPREEKFFADFAALADRIVSGATLLERMLASDPPSWDTALQIKQVEHECDSLTHGIIQRLNSTFVTPIDREDIHALATSLDDVMDAIDAASGVLRRYRMSSLRYGTRELASLINRPEEMELFGKLARGRAQNVYGWESIARQTVEVYDEAIHGKIGKRYGIRSGKSA